MINVAFYLGNKSVKDVDCRNVLEEGNPGIGGSEYAIVLLCTYLYKNYNDKFNLTLFADEIDLLPIRAIKVNGIEDAISKAENGEYSIFVSKYTNSIEIYRKNTVLKFIILCENFVKQSNLNFFAKQNNVKCLVCVGREQLDLYRDHEAFNKSTFIYNGISLKNIENYLQSFIPFSQRKNEVTYIGCIIPSKGFHFLAKAWPKVIQKIPDAHLNVIGSGVLYNRQVELGRFGIAEKEYEASFMKYLTDENGNIDSSVTFHGILGVEKNEILNRTKVGVPNPSGATETFGYTAVEMQINGALIVAKKCPGYMDTFYKKENLIKNENHLAGKIIELLQTNNNQYDEVYSFVKENFSIENVAKKWYKLFLNLTDNKPIEKESQICNVFFNSKWLTEINRWMKNNIPGGQYFPPVLFYKRVLNSFVIRIILLQKNIRRIKG